VIRSYYLDSSNDNTHLLQVFLAEVLILSQGSNLCSSCRSNLDWMKAIVSLADMSVSLGGGVLAGLSKNTGVNFPWLSGLAFGACLWTVRKSIGIHLPERLHLSFYMDFHVLSNLLSGGIWDGEH
jgi:hypothetical protein